MMNAFHQNLEKTAASGYNIDIRPESGYYGEEEPKAAEAEKTEDTAAE